MLHSLRSLLLAASLLTVGLQASPTLPSGGSVSVGTGAISTAGSTLTVTQVSDKLAINWDSFSIAPGASVRFVQPSTSSVVLNRVTGADASVIQGKLSANGRVFLLNPSGILFTQTAQVNVGSLVASTLALSDDDFVAGNYSLSQPGAGVVTNEGTLVATAGGDISLIAAQVVNTGDISAERGSVHLAAGARVTLNLGGMVNLTIEEGVLDALVRNGGAIHADGGRVLLTARGAGDLAAATISNEGLIEARTLATGEFGEVLLLGDLSGGDTITLGGKIDVSSLQDDHGGFLTTYATSVQLAPDLVVDGRAPNGLLGGWVLDPAAIAAPGVPSALSSQIQIITTTLGPTIDPLIPVTVNGISLNLMEDHSTWREITVAPVAYNPGTGGGGLPIGLNGSDTLLVGTVMACANFEFAPTAFFIGSKAASVGLAPALVNPLGAFRLNGGLKLDGIRLDGPAFEGAASLPKPLFEE